jgi:hypothetical protein
MDSSRRWNEKYRNLLYYGDDGTLLPPIPRRKVRKKTDKSFTGGLGREIVAAGVEQRRKKYKNVSDEDYANNPYRNSYEYNYLTGWLEGRGVDSGKGVRTDNVKLARTGVAQRGEDMGDAYFTAYITDTNRGNREGRELGDGSVDFSLGEKRMPITKYVDKRKDGKDEVSFYYKPHPLHYLYDKRFESGMMNKGRGLKIRRIYGRDPKTFPETIKNAKGEKIPFDVGEFKRYPLSESIRTDSLISQGFVGSGLTGKAIRPSNYPNVKVGKVAQGEVEFYIPYLSKIEEYGDPIPPTSNEITTYKQLRLLETLNKKRIAKKMRVRVRKAKSNTQNKAIREFFSQRQIPTRLLMRGGVEPLKRRTEKMLKGGKGFLVDAMNPEGTGSGIIGGRVRKMPPRRATSVRGRRDFSQRTISRVGQDRARTVATGERVGGFTQRMPKGQATRPTETPSQTFFNQKPVPYRNSALYLARRRPDGVLLNMGDRGERDIRRTNRYVSATEQAIIDRRIRNTQAENKLAEEIKKVKDSKNKEIESLRVISETTQKTIDKLLGKQLTDRQQAQIASGYTRSSLIGNDPSELNKILARGGSQSYQIIKDMIRKGHISDPAIIGQLDFSSHTKGEEKRKRLLIILNEGNEFNEGQRIFFREFDDRGKPVVLNGLYTKGGERGNNIELLLPDGSKRIIRKKAIVNPEDYPLPDTEHSVVEYGGGLELQPSIVAEGGDFSVIGGEGEGFITADAPILEEVGGEAEEGEGEESSDISSVATFDSALEGLEEDEPEPEVSVEERPIGEIQSIIDEQGDKIRDALEKEYAKMEVDETNPRYRKFVWKGLPLLVDTEANMVIDPEGQMPSYKVRPFTSFDTDRFIVFPDESSLIVAKDYARMVAREIEERNRAAVQPEPEKPTEEVVEQTTRFPETTFTRVNYNTKPLKKDIGELAGEDKVMIWSTKFPVEWGRREGGVRGIYLTKEQLANELDAIGTTTKTRDNLLGKWDKARSSRVPEFAMNNQKILTQLGLMKGGNVPDQRSFTGQLD